MCFLEALHQHPSLTAESDASMERKPRGLSLPWTVPPTTAEGRLPGPGSAPSSVGKPHEWGLHARFLLLFTVRFLFSMASLERSFVSLVHGRGQEGPVYLWVPSAFLSGGDAVGPWLRVGPGAKAIL